jgi:hypothetical protein
MAGYHCRFEGHKHGGRNLFGENGQTRGMHDIHLIVWPETRGSFGGNIGHTFQKDRIPADSAEPGRGGAWFGHFRKPCLQGLKEHTFELKPFDQ